MLQIAKSKQAINWYNRDKKMIPKYRAEYAKHLSLSPDIISTIHLKYHMCRICCPKIILIQQWTNPQLQSKKCSLVGMRKSQWFSHPFLSQWFVIVFPSQMSHVYLDWQVYQFAQVVIKTVSPSIVSTGNLLYLDVIYTVCKHFQSQ